VTSGAAGSSEVRPFSVLVVCTGNICRSPAAQALLSAALGEGQDIEVASAGLRARVGEPMAAETARVLDVPVEGFRARQLTGEMVGAAGLVLTMTRDHRAALVDAVPAAIRRTFTLREFADLAVMVRQRGSVAVDGPRRQQLQALTVATPRLRGRRRGAPDDIDDPYGRPPEQHAHAVAEIRQAIGRLVSTLDAAVTAEAVRPRR
jgi:protein-tyrosine phosphatase